MRLSVIIILAMAVMISMVTASKHKKTLCDSCTDGHNTCMDVGICGAGVLELLLTLLAALQGP
jgi:hypothetical protein